MEGTVTISIKEYEGLKDLPNIWNKDRLKLEKQIKDLTANAPIVTINYRYYGYDSNPIPYKTDYRNLDKFVQEEINKVTVLNEDLIERNNTQYEKIRELESILNQPKEEKKKRFWFF